MGEEEGTMKTESQPESVASVLAPSPPLPQEEHSPAVEEKEPEKADPPTTAKEERSVSFSVTTENDTSPIIQEAEVADPTDKKDAGDPVNRDAVLARVETEKRFALIKAWEESEKTKAENRAHKKLSAVGLWEDSKKASAEAQLKKLEEKMEKKKVEYVERMKNKKAEIHRLAEEKRATVEAQRREEFLELEETAAKFRSRGYTPRKLLACFSG